MLIYVVYLYYEIRLVIFMLYYAHKTDDGKRQTVKEHLENVAKTAESFAVNSMKPLAYVSGNLHDIGKYAKTFQKRLDGSGVRYEHSSCGAIEYSKMADESNDKAVKLFAPMIEYCIAGHHTGLPDGGSEGDDAYNDVTLHSRLKRMASYTGESDYSAYKDEVQITLPDTTGLLSLLESAPDFQSVIEKYAFFTRYLFSCLTDADFLDTEQFCSPEIKRELHADFSSVTKRLEQKFSEFRSETPLQSARGALQKQAYENAKGNENISILNMPTGSGKTLCSLKIALDKLNASNGKIKRIIYVIPYTSIIEQTAELFSSIFGDCADILQHHSNFSFDDGKEIDAEQESTSEKLKKASENWDAPFIVTTNVQFFESLYHYKSSKLRKLHNLADSIIIFDEIHMLPLEMIQPCLRGIGYVTKYLGSQAILLSATMPDLKEFFRKYSPDCSIKQLIDDKSDFSYFRKNKFINLGKTDIDSIIEQADQYNSSLIIVNTRKSARDIYRRLNGRKYHLSTFMTPADRSETISRIRRDLKSGEKITVVSTSLIEAGVDLDFETVFRELSGLDNILQSAGRCNREGKRSKGNVYIFQTDEKNSGETASKANIVEALIDKYDDITSPECIQEYFRRSFDFNEDIIEKNSIAKKKYSTSIDNIGFRKYADDFNYIKDNTIAVVINNCSESDILVKRLKNADRSVKRKLQRYSVSLKRFSEFEKALSMGIIEDNGTGVYVLTNLSYYNSETGLDLDLANDIIM